MEIRGKRISIKPFKVEDVYYMRNWGYHENPLLGDYNFPFMTDKEIEIWYKMKAKNFFNKYYGVFNENDILIGYMGIKGINYILRRSTLGIVFDPNYINKGYGTETLKYYLKYYFTKMKMRSMYLEVAEFNTRAYSVYKKMGFKSVGYYLDEFYDSNLDLSSTYYLNAKSSFVISDGKVYNYIYRMRLDREDYLKKFTDI
ncbi:GNAT family N-acetyltransferase [Wansuia hejianensis]|uniref:GNAT family N-acetyltransferase n=1 Tax=Wansuia hejianensis TaxID=2763667 RepID=A0A926F1V2_9FIRM|nr:GNAT family N-acetyltransferase [Wansuia hejianensis]MBC8590379.1 GNAT family N-acetyltransferase [Wansuia hejianensis]